MTNVIVADEIEIPDVEVPSVPEPSPDSPTPGPSRRGATVPLIVAMCLAITGVLWLTLRSVEADQAEAAHERVVTAARAELRSEIEAHVGSIEGVAGSLGSAAALDPTELDPTELDPAMVERFGRVVQRNDLINADSAIAEVALVSVLGEDPTVAALFGAFDPDRFVDRPIATDGPVAQAIEFARSNKDAVVLGTEVVGPLELFENTDPGVVIVSPVINSDDSLDAVVVSRLLLSDIVDALGEGESTAAIEVALDGDIVASSPLHRSTQGRFGSDVEFETDGAVWTIRATDGGLEVDHVTSWVVLLGGIGLSALAAVLAGYVRRNAITLGRLTRIEYDARHDLLTGLVNRAGLTDELHERVADRRTNNLVGVLLLDLDRLKVVNDSIGHSAGDEVLNAVADRLRLAVREEDVVGRFGGDEFVVISSGVPAVRDLTNLAERILAALKEPAVLSDESSQMISASIGIAYVSNGDASAESLLRDADVAMYKAKEAGGSRYVVFDSELRDQAVARLEVERELRRAIRTGQLVVHYQPIIDTETGGVDRLEALVRWQHPVRGMVPPGSFLSVAAESGLIVDVGEHVLRESCRQAALWSSAVGHPVMVSVNVAERQLIDSGLLELVKRVLAETGLSPAQLELELSEELIVERLDTRLSILRDLVDLGVKLAIDDFGTSRASLSQLKQLDMVSTLKIDRAFVIDVATDLVDRKIITAIVALADSMGMETIAEGVEDADQVSVLRALGIHRIQGFYFHRPAPSAQVMQVLAKSFEVPDAATGELV